MYWQARCSHCFHERMLGVMRAFVEVPCHHYHGGTRVPAGVSWPCLLCHLQHCQLGFCPLDGFASVVELIPNVTGDDHIVVSVVLALG